MMLPHLWILLFAASNTWAQHSSAPQFRSFYPQWRPWQLQFSSEICNSTLAEYTMKYAMGGPLAHPAVDACYNHTSCIIDHTPEAWKASMAAASVALGLLPTLLAAIGPSISEISLLSSQRPLLAFLISLGATATQPSRLLEYDDPIDLLSVRGGRLVVPPLGYISSVLVSGLEYLAAAAAVGNALQTSYRLGVATVSAASCTIWELPLIWSLLSVIVHLIAAIGFYIRVRNIKKDFRDPGRTPLDQSGLSLSSLSKQPGESQEISATQSDPQRGASSARAGNKSCLRILWHTTLEQSKCEFLLCSNRPRPMFRRKTTAVPRLAVLLAVLASLIAYVQLVYGTVFLASLLFISVKDAVVNVVLRFVLSALLCRLILLVELGGLREVES